MPSSHCPAQFKPKFARVNFSVLTAECTLSVPRSTPTDYYYFGADLARRLFFGALFVDLRVHFRVDLVGQLGALFVYLRVHFGVDLAACSFLDFEVESAR